MSAPIDDLLYGGDDSGDDDDLDDVPMSSFSAPLPSTSGALPMAVPLGAPSAVLAPPAGVVGGLSAPLAMNPASVSAPVSSMTSVPPSSSSSSSSAPSSTAAISSTAPMGGVARPVAMNGPGATLSHTQQQPAQTVPAAAAAVPAAPLAPAQAPVKQQPGSGHQMFQQMFALLKQMLPPEQYAALHSEMRNGNGNDIKSIVDIIKRIAGDAIFSSVIQKMDLTRNHSVAAGSLGIVKTEPVGGAAASGAITGGAAPVLAAPATAAAPQTAIAAPLSAVNPLAASAPAVSAIPVSVAPTALQRPTLVAATPPPALVSSGIKAEPLAMPMATMTPPATTPSTTTMATAATTAALTPSSATSQAATSSTTSSSASASGSGGGSGGGKADTQEKIEFAKKLLFHASSCTLPPGVCTVKRCDDVRRVFKHSVSCGGARGCSHCKQLKALVEYHAKECLVPVGEHCKIPFCDGIRRNNATARARAATTGMMSPSIATATTSSSSTTAAGGGVSSSTTAASAGSVMSDDDEDNTPLASAVTKVKKNAKSKSPKASPAASTSGGAASAAAKKKAASGANSKPSTPAISSNVSTPSSTGSSTPASGATTAAATAAAAAAAAKAKPVSAALAQAQEYGRLLQLILHVETCKTSTCAVGEDCVESKALLRQMNSPDAPARAQTYKKVFAHYKVCVAKKTTQTCPMCKIGLLPLELPGEGSSTATGVTTATGSTASTSSTAAGSSTASSAASHMSPATTAAVPATSPSVASLKRSGSSLASPRSPNKKPRVTGKGGKATGSGEATAAALAAAASAAAAADLPSSDLAPTSRNDLRKEEDVLTHTLIDLNGERRIMMDGSRRRALPERLPCQKEAWIDNDLFTNDKLTRHMERIAATHGVSLGNASTRTTQVMAHALQEYLKQVVEEMVEAARLRGDMNAQMLDHLVKKEMSAGTSGSASGGMMPRELTSTDILRVSCDDSFARVRQDDLALRARLLEDAKREELAEKERAKKRKKVDRVKLQAQEEKDEAEMDVEELAVKDLKERLLQEDKDGVLHVDGRVNESITAKFVRRVDDQVTMEDATYWLTNQKPFLHPKLFVRAEAARIATKALL